MALKRLAAMVAAIGIGLLVLAYCTAVSDPVVHHAEIDMLPGDGPDKQLRLLVLSDIHVAGPDMPPTRLRRIVRQVNAQRPDVVLIAGDFISDKSLATRPYSLREAIEPLEGLRSRLGIYAVLGNHDHWRNAGATLAELNRANIHVLNNSAARSGPLVIGGLDDPFTRHDNLAATLRAMAKLGGTPMLLSHSPDPFPRVPAQIRLMLAGHTHCGQITLPLAGAVSTMSAYGEKYACGVVTEGGKTLIVSAGLGTSILPLRLGAVPDMWIVVLKRRRALPPPLPKRPSGA